jgi:Glycosyl transferase family 2
MDYVVRTEEEQAAFFGAVMAATRAAEAAVGSHTVALEVAGLRIDIVFAGPTMQAELLPALRHLVVHDAGPAQTTVHVWDGRSSGVTIPPPPCSRDHFTDRGDLWGFTSERYRTAFHWIEYSVNVMDLESGVGVFWIRDTAQLPYWTKASPLRTMLHWCLERSGAQLLHAAAVGSADGAVLITGKGGVGKSTTALTSLVYGLSYAADDYLAVRLEPTPMVYSLYSTAKLNAQDVVKFPSLAPHVTNLPSVDGEKAVMHLYPDFEPQILRGMPLRAVLTPRVFPQPQTDLVPADRLTLSRAAAFTTLSQLPYAGQQTQDFIEAMIQRLPGFEIHLGSDPARVVQAIRDLLAMDDTTLRERAQQPAGGADVGAVAQPPLISVIVPVYNGAHFIAQAIDSILAQNYPCLEIIVVDDGSSDDIEAAITKLPVDVRFFRQDNAGPAAARNRGIRDASGDYIAFLDVDDLWPADNLRALGASLAARPELVVAHGYAQMLTLDPASGVFERQGNPAESFPYYIGAGLYRREAFERIGLFDHSMRFGEDTDWYNRLRESGLPAERLPQVTLCVRRHGANMTAGLSNQEHCATALMAFKKAIDRKRRAAAAPAAVTTS